MRVVLVLGMACVGCASLMPLAGNPAALHDAYLIAHGMATSYVERPDANPAVVQQLVVMDGRAAAAMRDRDTGATEDAVAALTSVAARREP